MNVYQKLIQMNHDYHILVEEVLQLEVGEVEQRVKVKTEFSARAADVMQSMTRANNILKPYFQ